MYSKEICDLANVGLPSKILFSTTIFDSKNLRESWILEEIENLIPYSLYLFSNLYILYKKFMEVNTSQKWTIDSDV